MSGTPWTQPEDDRLTAAHSLGMTWTHIADNFLPGRSASACQHRMGILQGKRVEYRKGEGGHGPALPITDDGARYGSQKLLEAQLRAGQYNGPARAAWLAKHGVAA